MNTANPLEIGCLYKVMEGISFRLPKNPNEVTLVFAPKLPWISGISQIIMPLEKDIECWWQYSHSEVNFKEKSLCMKLLANDRIYYFVTDNDFFYVNPDTFKLIEV